MNKEPTKLEILQKAKDCAEKAKKLAAAGHIRKARYELAMAKLYERLAA